MSQEIESFIADQESRGLGTRQQILDHFRKSDDPDWKNYFANQNKANVEEKKQTLMDMATTPHPVFGVSPLDMLIYGGGAALTAGAAWKLGQKGAEAAADLSSKAYGSASNAIKNRWMGKPAVDVSQTVAQQQPGFTPSPSSTEAPPVSMYSEAEQEMIKRSAENAAAKAQEAEVKRLQGQSAVPGGVAPAAAPAPVAPAQITPEAPKSGFAWDQPQTMQPTVTQAVEAGVSPTQALQVEVAKQIDAPTTEKTIKRRVTKEQKAALEKAAPEGFRTQYTKKPGEMGPGAYNWLYGQEGEKAPEVWKALFGNKNIPYSHEPSSELQSKYAEYKMGIPEPGGGLNEPPRVEGGAHKKPTYIPKNIKGAVAPGALGPLGLLAAALGMSSSPEAQAAMQKASGAIKDIGVSPDIFQGKGEELGRLGTAYVTAGNPVYRAELLTQMKNEKNPDRYKILMEEYQKAGGNVNGGVGIAPPR